MKSLVLLVSLCSLTLAATRLNPIVSTKVGLIRGVRDENGYSKFLGIPYGKVGKNVFAAAEPYPSFDDIFEANDDSNICIRSDRYAGGFVGTTDCLRVNIYVPDSVNSNRPLPVMVMIHGGAFVADSDRNAISNPVTLLRHDVIIVAVQYRIGIFGFMCLEIPEVPGNTGLKDQVLGLRWIKENIEAFGGDPNQITAFGTSAGGMSINLHLFSHYEKLFDRAIISSGPANSYWTIVESDTTVPIRLAAKLGLNTTDIYEALSFITEGDPLILAQIALDLQITDSRGLSQPLTKPCIETRFEGVEHFITEHPMNSHPTKASTTPIIIGCTDRELAFEYHNLEAEYFNNYDFTRIFSLGFNMSYDLSEAMESLKNFYVGGEVINEKVKWKVIDSNSDLIFMHSTQRMAQQLVDSGAENVYRYVFEYSGSNSEKTWTGAMHGDDTMYLYDWRLENKTEEDELMIDRYTTLWTNFAKYGEPTPTTSELLPVKWIPITSTEHPYLAIDSELTLRNRPLHDRMAFMDLFYKNYGYMQKFYKPKPWAP